MSNKTIKPDTSLDTVAENDPYKSLRDLIKSTKGRFTTLEFIKANGEVRKMLCRTGVKKGVNPDARTCVNGTTNTTAHIPKYINVYEIGVGDRKINLETLRYLKCGKILYQTDH